MKFLRCAKCGKIVGVIQDSACPTMCCGQAMEEMSPNTTDGAHEKHVPVITIEGSKVTVEVGSAAHPMLDAHYIEWVAIQTKSGNQRKSLNPGEEPKVTFALVDGDEVEAVYAYCHLHGLWKA